MVGLLMRLSFLWCQPLKIIRKYSAKKIPALCTLFLTPAPWPFEVTFLLVKLHIVFVPFCRGKYVFSETYVFCSLGARWHQKKKTSCHSLYIDDLPGAGPTFEDHPQVFGQKKVQPLTFYFWHLRLGLFNPLFWLVKCACTLLQRKCVFSFANYEPAGVLNSVVWME